MSKHTQGPWEIVGSTHVWSPSAKANIASASALRTIRYVGYAPPEIGDLAEVAANARLIAAAPDLLAACESALKPIDYNCGNVEQMALRNLLRAAIAKATQP